MEKKNFEWYKRCAKIMKKDYYPDIPLMKIQHQVALQHGFKNWSELKKSTESEEKCGKQ